VSPALAATSRLASVSNSSTTTVGAEVDAISNRFLLAGGPSSNGGGDGGDFIRVSGTGDAVGRLLDRVEA